MRNEKAERLMDLSRQSDDVKLMVRVVCDAEGATSAAHLFDVNPEAFNELFDAAEELIAQLPDKDTL